MDTATPASVEVRGALLAGSVGGESGVWRNRVPIGKRAINLVGIIQRSGRPTRTLQRQKSVGQETQRCMMVETGPGATLKVVQSQLLLELLVALLHLPACLPQTDRLHQRGRRRQVCQRVADRTIAAPLHQ